MQKTLSNYPYLALKMLLRVRFFGIQVCLAFLTYASRFINFFIKSRINKYMNLHELSEDRDVKKDETNESAVKIEKASFSWSNADEPTLKNIDVEIKKKSLTAIVGSVGSGKSSLLSAMLGKKLLATYKIF